MEGRSDRWEDGEHVSARIPNPPRTTPAFVVNDVVTAQFEENFRYWEEEKEKINDLLPKD